MSCATSGKGGSGGTDNGSRFEVQGSKFRKPRTVNLEPRVVPFREKYGILTWTNWSQPFMKNWLASLLCLLLQFPFHNQ
jgi:hypothetical protein